MVLLKLEGLSGFTYVCERNFSNLNLNSKQKHFPPVAQSISVKELFNYILLQCYALNRVKNVHQQINTIGTIHYGKYIYIVF